VEGVYCKLCWGLGDLHELPPHLHRSPLSYGPHQNGVAIWKGYYCVTYNLIENRRLTKLASMPVMALQTVLEEYQLAREQGDMSSMLTKNRAHLLNPHTVSSSSNFHRQVHQACIPRALYIKTQAKILTTKVTLNRYQKLCQALRDGDPRNQIPDFDMSDDEEENSSKTPIQKVLRLVSKTIRNYLKD